MTGGTELQRILAHLVRACDIVFGSSSILLAAIATWCAITGDIHIGLVVAVWAVPIFNLVWSRITRHAETVRSDVTRGLACVPLSSYIYVAEPVGVLHHLWLPALVVSVGTCMSAGIRTRRATTGFQIAISYAIGMLTASLLWTGEVGSSAIRDASGLLIVGTILSIVAANLGRTVDIASDAIENVQRELAKRIAIEAELHQAQKLEAVGRLAAGIAHEINTPVQYVGDSLDFIRTSVTDLFELVRQPDAIAFKTTAEAIDLPFLREEVPKALARATDGLGRVSTIVRSMKVFARADSAAMQPTDLNRAIEATLVVASNEYKYVADLVTELDPVPDVCCHAGEINQVVLNVIVNAGHAIAEAVGDSGRRGTIHVRTHRVDDDVVIAIHDTGLGIPEAIRGRIFDPFFTTKGVGKGTGQGLSIAHHVIVDKHHGKLAFESEVGLGTTFFIHLPIAGVAAA